MSILRIFSKILEKLLQNQLLVFFDNILSKIQCGFRKCYGTQSCLLLMLEFWKDAADKTKAFSVLGKIFYLDYHKGTILGPFIQCFLCVTCF